MICVEIIKFFVSLEMAGVSEIGRKCLLRFVIGFYFGRGIIFASFYEVGIFCFLRLVFSMEVMGCIRIFVYFFRS